MTLPFLLLASSALWSRSQAQSGNASTAFVTQQYCFPKSGDPFSTNSLLPSVTMMYSGITLTTAPLTLNGAEPTGQPVDSPSGPANSTAVSSLVDAAPVSDATGTRVQSSAGSVGSAPTPSVAVPSSLASAGSDGAQGMSSMLETGSSMLETGSSAMNAVPTSVVDGSASPPISSSQFTVGTSAGITNASGQPAASPSVSGISEIGQPTTGSSASDMSDADQPASGAGPSNSPVSPPASIGEPTGTVATTAASNAPGVSSFAGLSPSGATPTQTDLGSKLTPTAGMQASASAGPYGPTGALLVPGASQQNGTVSLSPSSVSALQLALVLKNLGGSLFNESRVVEPRLPSARGDAEGLASLVAEIAVVSSPARSPY
ncbi:hypothetical protein IG631_22599 [Alternaria alternata]|nr:hypothetical protein IG631_22599 [Alternaria alternata]